jgi:hypothetical protein
MVRKIAGLLAAVFFVGGLSLAAEDKKDDKKSKFDPLVIGKFESYKNEILKLSVEKAQGGTVIKEEKEFKVPGDTPVGYIAGKDEKGKDKKTVLKAKQHLKDVEKGTLVTVALDDKKKVLGVGVVVSELPKVKAKDDKDKEK